MNVYNIIVLRYIGTLQSVYRYYDVPTYYYYYCHTHTPCIGGPLSFIIFVHYNIVKKNIIVEFAPSKN